LGWTRDGGDAFLFHVDVPADTYTIDVDFDYVSPSVSFGTGFGKSPNVTPHLLEILFGQLLLYPADARADSLLVHASVQFPRGWTYDGALIGTRNTDGTVTLPIVPLSRLVDSPLLAGEHTRSVAIPSRAMHARLWIAADDKASPGADRKAVDALGRLIDETVAVVGKPERADYVWLLALSDVLTHDGTEHRESSDVREAADFFRDGSRAYRWTVLPHELFHAWNGKFRRPAGLVTANFQQPMNDELLWIYEGLTRYYGDVVLPTRSGLATKEQTLDYLAYVAAQVQYGRPGRSWRSVADTAVAIPGFADAPFEGSADRRGADYYNEGMLIWLEADVLIRQSTHGARSLDDFCRAFFAQRDVPGGVLAYRRSDVMQALHAVADIDWETFFASRIDRAGAPVPLNGLHEAGWSVTYDDTPNRFADSVQKDGGAFNFSTTLGFWIAQDGTIQDVASGSPAAQHAMASGWRITAVNGGPWSLESLREALRPARHAKAPIRLKLAYMDIVRTLEIDWHEGLRVPHLYRQPSSPDVLGRIFAPRRASDSTPHP
ncbi:MAG TPA: hypothetical protein VIM98_03930, partial [Dyella sp.]|uniref:M61 family metallopeptidase n=1 Tax=Dyella sp. TaxID=1869338 RepID=UPI002F95B384